MCEGQSRARLFGVKLTENTLRTEPPRPIATGLVGDSDITAQRYCAIASESESTVRILCYIATPFLTSFEF